jgi:arylsulfatase A-like enzyme
MLGTRLSPILFAATIWAAPLRAEEPPRPRPRGLILISIDTLRADHLGAYGASSPTPAFDAFARQGLLFENAISAATWTVPSHATMLTGLYSSSHGAGERTLDEAADGGVQSYSSLSPNAATLTELLRARGFKTAGFHFGPTTDARWGFGRGFDTYESGAFNPGPSSGTFVETTFQDAASWLERNGGAPYFLFIHTFQVHRYGFIALDANGGSACPPRFDYALNLDEQLSASDRRCAESRARYRAAVACADEEFGRLMARLDAAGAFDAVVVVVSDHGEALCEPHARAPLIGHGYAPYESLIRVPLAVRLPGGDRAGQRRMEPASLVDVTPTVLDALGVPTPEGLQGRSLLASGSADRPLFAESDAAQMVESDGFKYIRHNDGLEELFDVARDSSEARGLDSAPLQRGRLDAMRARLRAFNAAQRAGLRLLVRGRRGDRFRIRVEADEPMGFPRALLSESSDTVTRSPDGRSVTADFVSDEDGDEDWLVVGESAPVERGARPPRRAWVRPPVMRVSASLNGKPVPAARFFVGGRRAKLDGRASVDLGSRDGEVDALSVPDGAAVVLWRMKAGNRGGAAIEEDRMKADLKADLKAAGYAP